MTDKKGIIPVLAAPLIDPRQARIAVELPAGLTIAAIVDQVLPDKGLPRDSIRVALVSPAGSAIVLAATWDRVRPRPGVRVVIRVVPGDGLLRSVLQIVVSIAAIALGAFFAPALAGAIGISQGFAQGIIGLGATVLGNLLINALIPPPKPDPQQKNTYSISGWRNRLDPDGAIPVVMGSIRFAPPFACLPHTQIVGDDQYVCVAFNVGYGRVLTDDYRIGETSLSEYKNVEIDPRQGIAGEPPLGLIARQVAEETVGAELTRPLPRDARGEIVAGPAIETPVVRTTGADASGAGIIFAWPAGLFHVGGKKAEIRISTVRIKIEQRLVQAEEWQPVTTLEFTARKREAFFRQHSWSFPSRGRWQVRVTMLTDETTSTQHSTRTSWAALQTLRPEYPINFGKPVALVALRVKATHQLNGQLDNFNLRARRVCLDWDHESETWVSRETRNPASLYRYVLQSSANARPVANAGIDLEQLADWHDFCRVKGLKYDRVIDDPSLSLRDVLTEIAGAGRASPRHDGRKWGVVIDRPQELIVDHFSPRNAYGFKVSRTYLRHPHAISVQFLDETNDNKQAVRVVPWPGHTGDITEVERFELPGKTDPVEIFREIRRRMYEVMYRPDVHRLSLDGPIGVATRGDKVMVSQDIIERTQVAARVKSIAGNLVEIDETVTMDAGKTYAIRFRRFMDEDTIGTSVVRSVVTAPGEHSLLHVSGTGAMPSVGSLLHFGISGSESFPLIVTAVEAGQDISSHLRLVDAAPIIDQLTDALVIPAWSGRVGAEIGDSVLQPPEPRFVSVTSGPTGVGSAGLITYLIEPGEGTVATATIVIQHRLAGASSWSIATIPVANGGGKITGYVVGAEVEISAYGVSPASIDGPATPVIGLTVGEDAAAIPDALVADDISVGALFGGAVVQFATTADAATTSVQIYRSTSPVLDRATDAVGDPVDVRPSRSYSTPIGDTTRTNLVLNGNFDSTSSWSLGSGWSIAAGKASHAPGSSSAVSQALAAQAGKYYRVSFQLSGVTAGDITPQLTGGATRAGDARSGNGVWSDRIQAVTGNNTIELRASSTFDGDLDGIAVYLETSTCLAQGTHNIWLEPQNDDGLPGPVAGPFSITIR